MVRRRFKSQTRFGEVWKTTPETPAEHRGDAPSELWAEGHPRAPNQAKDTNRLVCRLSPHPPQILEGAGTQGFLSGLSVTDTVGLGG